MDTLNILGEQLVRYMGCKADMKLDVKVSSGIPLVFPLKFTVKTVSLVEYVSVQVSVGDWEGAPVGVPERLSLGLLVDCDPVGFWLGLLVDCGRVGANDVGSCVGEVVDVASWPAVGCAEKSSLGFDVGTNVGDGVALTGDFVLSGVGSTDGVRESATGELVDGTGVG